MAYIFSSIALFVSVAGFFFILRYVTKRTSVERIPADTREAVNQIIAEIDRVTDRDSLLVEERVKEVKRVLDAREQELRALLDETGKRLSLLLKEGAKFERSGALYDNLGRQKAVRTALENGVKKNEEAASGVETARETAGDFAPSKAAAPSAVIEQGGGTPPQSAADLAAQGLPPSVIASRLGKSITEVEMEIILNKRS